jgi:hypothetical protein
MEYRSTHLTPFLSFAVFLIQILCMSLYKKELLIANVTLFLFSKFYLFFIEIQERDCLLHIHSISSSIAMITYLFQESFCLLLILWDFCKEPQCKYFGLCRPVTVAITKFCYYSRKAAICDMLRNECASVPIKLYVLIPFLVHYY